MNNTNSEGQLRAETESPKPRRRRSWLWRVGRFCLLGFITLVTLYVFLRVEEDWRGKRAWQHYKESMEAKGAVFELEKLVPPPAPDDQNFAMTPLLKPILDLYPPGTTNASRWRDEEGKKRLEAIQLEDSQLNDKILSQPLPDQKVSASGINQVPGREEWRLGERASLEDWQKYYRESDLFPSWAEPKTPAEDVLKALSRYDAELAELQKASERPYARFPVFYGEENPAAVMLPHLKVLRAIGKVVQLRAVAELKAGDTAAAFSDVELLFTLANSIESEPTLISYLVRLALLSVTEETVWEGLADHRWTEDQLVELQHQFSRLDLVHDLKWSMESERAWGTEIYEWMIGKPEALFELSNDHPSSLPKMAFKLVPTGWICLEGVSYGEEFDRYYIQVLPNTAGELNVNEIKRSSEEFERAMTDESNLQAFFKHRILLRILMPALDRLPPRAVQAEAFKDMTVLAIALERYQLAQQAYPQTLGQLVPEYLSRQLMDPVTQQPFRYEQAGSDSFRLWSVGWDAQDDGGVVATRTKGRGLVTEEGDWVWPQPGAVRTRDIEE